MGSQIDVESFSKFENFLYKAVKQASILKPFKALKGRSTFCKGQSQNKNNELKSRLQKYSLNKSFQKVSAKMIPKWFQVFLVPWTTEKVPESFRN